MAQQIVSAVFNNKKLSKALDDLVLRSKEIQKKKRQFVDAVYSPVIFNDIIDHFNKEEGPDRKWKEWSPAYEKILAKTNPQHLNSGKKLQDTGNLRQHLSPRKRRITRANIVWFNNAKTKGGFPYAYAHDNDDGSRTSLPRRAFMWLSDKATKTAAQRSIDYLAGIKLKRVVAKK